MFRKPEIKLVELTNGVKVNEVLALTIMTMLNSGELGAIELYEILEKCNNPKHKFFGNLQEKFEQLNIVRDGKIDKETKNIFLCAIKSDGPLCYSIVLPYAEAEPQTRPTPSH